MRFIAKPLVVQGWQYAGTLDHVPAEILPHLRNANACQVDVVHADDHTLTVVPLGWWILRTAQDQCFVVSPTRMQQDYAQIDELGHAAIHREPEPEPPEPLWPWRDPLTQQRVWANRIAVMFADGEGHTVLCFQNDTILNVQPNYIQRTRARVGGYYVRDAEGHESWLAAKPFLQQYIQEPRC